jgi:hypothetical protein
MWDIQYFTRVICQPYDDGIDVRRSVMRAPLTAADLWFRADSALPDVTAVVDELNQPWPAVPTTTYREFGRPIRGWRAGGCELAVLAEGDPIAVASRNSTRLIELHALLASSRFSMPSTCVSGPTSAVSSSAQWLGDTANGPGRCK